MRKKRKRAPESGGAPEWMTTFSDLMTLLLTFFILLYSMSSVNNEKFSQAADSLKYSFVGSGQNSILTGGQWVPEENENAATGDSASILEMEAAAIEAAKAEDAQAELFATEGQTMIAVDPEVIKMYQEVKDFVEKNGLSEEISMSMDADGVYMNVKAAILFTPGSAVITESGTAALQKVAELIGNFENKVVIEGHTDNIPHHDQKFESNWELSAGRAIAVLRHLAEQRSIDPARLSAVGYGEYNPLVPNDTAEQRAENRRVNIVLVYEPEGAE
ncbi:flagellar motor protein MotB [Trichococcus pasteurii]|uniref:Membrane motb of proton-channel complex mota/motb n=1 Tax=Trichococcus pasteurii TaxID=43064 RepID=A0A1W1IIK5_9LACT|nr:flagellar motor protein MotB [Trichococcus pasteurii]SFE78220.1 chemotaxis protein MotB [Trichococcus pasteurii]SLM52856.1 membrane motb of proton-channel complex mota/motb [Trichococcus pasteurii]SSB93737.1 membrane motb of proton-channel complex mota/motb [Trichococcus pasteurii]